MVRKTTNTINPRTARAVALPEERVGPRTKRPLKGAPPIVALETGTARNMAALKIPRMLKERIKLPKREVFPGRAAERREREE